MKRFAKSLIGPYRALVLKKKRKLHIEVQKERYQKHLQRYFKAVRFSHEYPAPESIVQSRNQLPKISAESKIEDILKNYPNGTWVAIVPSQTHPSDKTQVIQFFGQVEQSGNLLAGQFSCLSPPERSINRYAASIST